MPHSRRTIRVTASAGRDLQHIGDYTEKEWGKRQRSSYLATIKEKLLELRDFPDIGTKRDDLRKDLRSHPVGRHIIFYEA